MLTDLGPLLCWEFFFEQANFADAFATVYATKKITFVGKIRENKTVIENLNI